MSFDALVEVLTYGDEAGEKPELGTRRLGVGLVFGSSAL